MEILFQVYVLYTYVDDSWRAPDMTRFCWLPYFISYKREFFFSFQNHPKNLDPSYKILLGFFKKGKICSIAKSHRTDLVICGQSREGKTPSYSRINTVFMIFSCMGTDLCFPPILIKGKIL